MPGTYSRLLYHVVFSTKGRANLITDVLQPRLFDYMGGIIRDEHGSSLAIGRMPDYATNHKAADAIGGPLLSIATSFHHAHHPHVR